MAKRTSTKSSAKKVSKKTRKAPVRKSAGSRKKAAPTKKKSAGRTKKSARSKKKAVSVGKKRVKTVKKAAKKKAVSPKTKAKKTAPKKKKHSVAGARKKVAKSAGKKVTRLKGKVVKKEVVKKEVVKKEVVKTGGAAKVSTKSSAKTSLKKPVKRSPVKKTPAKTSAKTPVKMPKRGPIRSPSHLDTRNLGRKTVRVADVDAVLPKSRLTPRERKEFERLLLAKRSELLGNMRHLAKSTRGQGDSGSGGRSVGLPTHVSDVGSGNWEQEFTFGLIENERTLIREIDEALQRIRDGSYGVCLATHKPIAKSRLKAKPWAKHCIEYARLRDLGRAP